MSNLSRRSLVTSAAALPALAVPAVAAPSTDPQLLALAERLKVLLPRATALRRHCARLNKQARGDLPQGFGNNENQMRIYQIRRKRNGGDKTWKEFNEVSPEMEDVGNAILEIPSTDPIGQGIRAAAALALDEHDTMNGFNMRGLLWEMAERAGFERPEEKA